MKRNTQQRQTILQVLNSAAGPLTPQEILEQASHTIPNIGLATIYRNLNSLVEAKQIIAVHLPNQNTRYESVGRGHHHHFHCEKCDGVFDLDTQCPVQMLDGVTLPSGFLVKEHSMTFYGICVTCNQSNITPS